MHNTIPTITTLPPPSTSSTPILTTGFAFLFFRNPNPVSSSHGILYLWDFSPSTTPHPSPRLSWSHHDFVLSLVRDNGGNGGRAKVLMVEGLKFSLRTDEEVDLAIYWYIHHPDIHLLELFAILIDVAERSSSSNASNTQSTDPARGLIRGMMIDLNITLEGSMHALNSTQDEVERHQIPTRPSDPTDESFFVDLFSLMKRLIQLFYPSKKLQR
ncbi:hypothetical protein PIB30_058782 [Stylosanthes scabra]|uniref:Uncharacterized protein n=1 Tax=Stylosanthes scabra TaxID=79078 RepID=A0ABU6VKC4_9FABA|nr:hypothetical protein [Stylosanthes scabra]